MNKNITKQITLVESDFHSKTAMPKDRYVLKSTNYSKIP